jgi:hypothetical protein
MIPPGQLRLDRFGRIAEAGRGFRKPALPVAALSALLHARQVLHVDASNDSAPILRRLGFRAVTTTTAYVWTPPQPARPG